MANMNDSDIALALAIKAIKSGGGGGGSTNNYHNLTNKPKVNDRVVDGNLTGNDLGLINSGDSLTEAQMSEILNVIV